MHPCLPELLYIVLFRTAIGIRCKDGIVLAVEKLVHSKLLVPGVNRRIQTIDKHIGLVSDFAYLPEL
jgi:20S proteasome alpha/beta subunit